VRLDSERTVLVQIGHDCTVPAILDSGANQVSLIPKKIADRIVDSG